MSILKTLESNLKKVHPEYRLIIRRALSGQDGMRHCYLMCAILECDDDDPVLVRSTICQNPDEGRDKLVQGLLTAFNKPRFLERIRNQSKNSISFRDKLAIKICAGCGLHGRYNDVKIPPTHEKRVITIDQLYAREDYLRHERSVRPKGKSPKKSGVSDILSSASEANSLPPATLDLGSIPDSRPSRQVTSTSKGKKRKDVSPTRSERKMKSTKSQKKKKKLKSVEIEEPGQEVELAETAPGTASDGGADHMFQSLPLQAMVPSQLPMIRFSLCFRAIVWFRDYSATEFRSRIGTWCGLFHARKITYLDSSKEGYMVYELPEVFRASCYTLAMHLAFDATVEAHRSVIVREAEGGEDHLDVRAERGVALTLSYYLLRDIGPHQPGAQKDLTEYGKEFWSDINHFLDDKRGHPDSRESEKQDSNEEQNPSGEQNPDASTKDSPEVGTDPKGDDQQKEKEDDAAQPSIEQAAEILNNQDTGPDPYTMKLRKRH